MNDVTGYTWNPKTRQYSGSNGKFVKRSEVKKALEAVIEAAAADIEGIARRFQASEIDQATWFRETAAKIKVINVTAAAVAVGGTHALTTSVLGSTAARIKK